MDKTVVYRIIKMFSNITKWFSLQFNRHSPIRQAFSFTVFIAIIFFAILVTLKIVNPYPLQGWVYLRLTLSDLGLTGVFIYIAIISFLPLFSPLSLLIVTGAAAFGPFYGIMLSYIGTIINANITYFLVKALSIDHAWGNPQEAPRSYKIKIAIQKRGYLIVLFFQLITIIPFVLINGAAGTAGISWRAFMKATSIGILPCVFMYTFIGEKMASSMFSPELYITCVSVAALCIIGIAIRKAYVKDSRKALP
jgi:uncharacterized membrane protein YdjX (TVP38/TMEM64 family)